MAWACAPQHTFAAGALSTRLVIQVDVQVGEAALWWQRVLGRQAPQRTKPKRTDGEHQGMVSTAGNGGRAPLGA